MTDAHTEPAAAPAMGDRSSVRERVSLVFGGIGVELLCDGTTPTRLSPMYAPYAEGIDAKARAWVTCSLATRTFGSESGDWRRLDWQWEDEHAQLEGATVQACLRRLGPRTYAATARIAPRADATSALVAALAAAVAEREGGFVLHAAALELAGAAVLFVGPSGAGKSTACTMVRGGRWLSLDSVAVLPTTSGWEAFALPGGTPHSSTLERSGALRAPLAAVLRVRQSEHRSEVHPLHGVGAIAAVRETVRSCERSRDDEAALLEATLRLTHDVPVGVALTKLGGDLTGALCSFMESVRRDQDGKPE